MTFARSSIIARTSRSGSRSPTPAAWLRTRLTCSSARRSGGIATSDSLPKPVVTPYATARCATRPSTTARVVSGALSRAAEPTETGARSRATAVDLLECQRISVENYFVVHGGNSTRPRRQFKGLAAGRRSDADSLDRSLR